MQTDDAGEVSSDDMARVDRYAIRRTLEQLGYLLLTRVHRAPTKPQRLPSEELDKRAREHLGRSPTKASMPLAKPNSNDKMEASTPRKQRLGDRLAQAGRAVLSQNRKCITPLIRV